MGRDHSCPDCGRGGFNDPDGSCVCEPAQSPEQGRVRRALERLQRATAEWAAHEKAPVAVAQALYAGRQVLGDEPASPDPATEQEDDR